MADEVPKALRTLTLGAPLSGYPVPTDRVPDSIFLHKMVSDEIALGPVGQSLAARRDGEAVTPHSANHTLTQAITGGTELLMLIGLDAIEVAG